MKPLEKQCLFLSQHSAGYLQEPPQKNAADAAFPPKQQQIHSI